MTNVRNVLLGAGVFVVASAAANLVLGADKLTVVSFGGDLTKSQVKAFMEPYTADTGIEFEVVDYNGGLAEIRGQVRSGDVLWDVVDIEMPDAVLGCEEGLLESIDPTMLPPATDGTPALEDFREGAVQPCAVGQFVWSTVVAYNREKFPENPPKSIADFFNIDQFPGVRGLRKSPKVTLEWALMADGVNPAEVYDVLSTPEGVDRAFKMLDKIKAHVIWWEEYQQAAELLADGQVDITEATNGRLYDSIVKEGKPFDIVWDGQVWDFDLWGIPRGSKNVDAALNFITYSTGTQQLADLAKYIPYGPARKSSMALVNEAMKSHLPTAPENSENAVRLNFRWWADNQDRINQRFSTWLGQPSMSIMQ